MGQYLTAMRWCMLVSSRWLPGYYDPRTRITTPPRYGWAVTDAGRRFLWRFGWVTGRLVPNAWNASAHLQDTAEDPCHALGQHASIHFMRPMSMALADLLWQLGPISVGRLAASLGIERQVLKSPL
jgi:hypothetical protein